MQDKKPMPGDRKKPPCKRKYLEDSSDESDDSETFLHPRNHYTRQLG